MPPKGVQANSGGFKYIGCSLLRLHLTSLVKSSASTSPIGLNAGQARFGRRRKRLASAASTYRIHSGAGQELLCAMEGEPGGHGDDKVNGSRNQSTAWRNAA